MFYIARDVDAAIEATEIEDEWGDPDGSWKALYHLNRGNTRAIVVEGDWVTVELMDKYEEGENDGYGAPVWVVVRAGSQFFKKTGYTSSYDGDQFDGACTEVNAHQKTVTYYE